MSAWILLRGLTRESRHWGDFPQILRDACPAARDARDRPAGQRPPESSRPARRASKRWRKAAATQLREQGIAPPYFVLAMSLGAMVAVAWAHRHPEEIGGCVLINTSLRPFSPLHHRLRPQNYLSLTKLLLRCGDAEERERTILRLTSCNAERPETLAAWAGPCAPEPGFFAQCPAPVAGRRPLPGVRRQAGAAHAHIGQHAGSPGQSAVLAPHGTLLEDGLRRASYGRTRLAARRRALGCGAGKSLAAGAGATTAGRHR